MAASSGRQNMISIATLVSFKEILLDTVFPRNCVFCDAVRVEGKTSVCPECLQSIRVISHPFCSQCGLPTSGLSMQSDGICGRCLAKSPPYSRARYAVYYEGQLRKALISFKYYNALNLAKTLSDILTMGFQTHYDRDEFDLIVPVPVHRKRLFKRGFNQAALLAAKLSGNVNVPLYRRSLIKLKDTPPQARLTRSQRIKNIRNSFGVRNPAKIQRKRVLLIDDVATTGSTITEATKTLIKAGAARVDALVLALRTADFFDSDQSRIDEKETANGVDDPGSIRTEH